MRGSGRARWAVALVSAAWLATGVSPAAAANGEAVTATGSVNYTWQGDPARGCATEALCGIHGELVLRSSAETQFLSPGGGPLSVGLNGLGTVRVLRQAGAATLGECVDSVGGPFESLNLQIRRRTASFQPAPSSGRCAGPAAAELAAIRLPFKRFGGRRPSFDLTGQKSFTAGPFSGTVVSTIKLVPARPAGGAFGGSFTSSSGGGSGQARPVQVETVMLQYRVAGQTGGLAFSFSGGWDPACQILDACGTSGSVGVSINPPRGLTLFASRTVHRRMGRRQALDDLRQGRLELFGVAPVSGLVNETLHWPDGTNCSDSVPMPVLNLGLGPPGPPARGKTPSVTLATNGTPVVDVLRTHCPGPGEVEMSGAGGTLAVGSITTSQLLARTSVLSLSDPGEFSGLSYTGSRGGSIRLDLTLTKVSAGTS